MSFPTIVYRCPGDHHCAGGTYGYKGAEDAEALTALLADGWFRSLPEAIAGDHDDTAPPTRLELETEAAALGIAFDGRTTDKRLAEKIEFVHSEREGE